MKKKYPSAIRLWHWLSALVLTGSLLTVLVNSTVMKVRKNAALIQTELAGNHIKISNDQALALGRALSHQVWQIHAWLGFGLAALLLFRIIAELFLKADQRLIRKIRTAYLQYHLTKLNREARHGFWVKTIYALFYFVLLLTVITGLCLALEDHFPVLKDYRIIRNIHQLDMYLILLFIMAHLAGVFLAERKKRSKGIVSDMIGGGSE